MLIDAKDRHYLIHAARGAEFHTHAGIVQHNGLIGVLEDLSFVQYGTQLPGPTTNAVRLVLKIPAAPR